MAPVHLEPRHKRESMVSGNNFWPHPNMPGFQTQGKMRKIIGTKSSYCTRSSLHVWKIDVQIMIGIKWFFGLQTSMKGYASSLN